MEISKNGGTPKWMVYKEKTQSKMDDLGVPPPDVPYVTIPSGQWMVESVAIPKGSLKVLEHLFAQL